MWLMIQPAGSLVSRSHLLPQFFSCFHACLYSQLHSPPHPHPHSHPHRCIRYLWNRWPPHDNRSRWRQSTWPDAHLWRRCTSYRSAPLVAWLAPTTASRHRADRRSRSNPWSKDVYAAPAESCIPRASAFASAAAPAASYATTSSSAIATWLEHEQDKNSDTNFYKILQNKSKKNRTPKFRKRKDSNWISMRTVAVCASVCVCVWISVYFVVRPWQRETGSH